ncbi:hypothetical protein VP01_3934g1, partial [Puccinia sorghi]
PLNWRIEEDKALCTCWLNTSKDAVVGTNQTKENFGIGSTNYMWMFWMR